MARTGQPATRQVAVVQRAVTILGELADARTELGTNEIARRTGINVSTISRILATLVSGGLVEYVAATGRYRLGLGVVRLASAVPERLDIRALARPHLAELVMFRYYAGLSFDETAGVVGRSVSTLKREWRYARAWLARQLGEGEPGGAEATDD